MTANFSPMIKRVAKALCNADDPMQTGEAENWRAYVPDARAAIEAMREPSHGMLVAAAPMPEHWSGTPAQLAACSGDQLSAKSTWRDMIDQALSEQPE